MWIPKDEAEILQAIQDKIIEEHDYFDAKKEIPKDLPKTVCGMANSGGGVILIGIEEDKNANVFKIYPHTLSGLKERIENMVRSSIEEIPQISVKIIESFSDSTKGYAVIVVSQSVRCPHMVIAGRSYKYYGRKGSESYPLNEHEIARLYEKRRSIQDNIANLLKEEIENSPFPPCEELGYLHVVIKPHFEHNLRTEGRTTLTQWGNLSKDLIDKLKSTKGLFVRLTSFPTINHLFYPRLEADCFYLSSSNHSNANLQEENRLTIIAGHLHFKVDFNGTGHLFCGKIARMEGNQKQIFWYDIQCLTIQFMEFMGLLYEQSLAYRGNVQIGFAVTGIRNAVTKYYEYPKEQYQQTGVALAARLVEEPGEIFNELSEPLFNVLEPS